MMDKQKVLKSLLSTPLDVRHLWDEGETQEDHEFILFFKPELTKRPVNLNKILDLFFSLVEVHKISLKECIVYPTKVVQEMRLMEQNYKKLNRIAHSGLDACSSQAAAQLVKMAPKNQIFGGYAFLEKYPYFSKKALSALVNNVETLKLGYGTYASPISLFDEQCVLLNGFHPYQIESLTAPEAFVVAFRCGSNRSWKDIRSQFVGTIDPKSAEKNSLRHQFWLHRKDLQMDAFSTAFNGVHVSAGPLEAMHQYTLFFGKPPSKTRFWKTASQQIPPEQLSGLSPDSECNGEPLYHLTEDVDMNETIHLIYESMPCPSLS